MQTLSEIKLRKKYHKGENESGSKSVALEPDVYTLLKEKADELGVTIKSLLSALISRHIHTFTRKKDE